MMEEKPEEDVRQPPVEEKPEESVEVVGKPAVSGEKEEHAAEEKPVEEQTVEEKPEEENLMIDDVMTAMEVEDESSCDDLMIDDLMMETDTESDDEMEVEDDVTNDEKPVAMKPEEEEKSVESEEEVVEDVKALEEKPEMKSTIVEDIEDEDENEQAPTPTEATPLPPSSEEKPEEIKRAEPKPVERKPEEKPVDIKPIEINPTPTEPKAATTHTPLHARLSQDAEAIYDDENLIEEGSDDDLHSLAIYVGSVSTTPEDSEVESENDSSDASSIEEMRIISGIMGSAPRGNERGRRDSVSREFRMRLPDDSRYRIPQGDAQDDDEDGTEKRTMKWNEPPSKRELVRPSSPITQGGAHAQYLNISSEHNTWCPWHANNDESVRRLIGVRKNACGYV